MRYVRYKSFLFCQKIYKLVLDFNHSLHIGMVAALGYIIKLQQRDIVILTDCFYRFNNLRDKSVVEHKHNVRIRVILLQILIASVQALTGRTVRPSLII